MNGYQAARPSHRYFPNTRNSNRRISWPYTLIPRNWRRGVKLLSDEASLPRKPVAEALDLLRELFPESDSALRNGLSGCGDLKILEYANAGGFVLVSTDSDFEGLSIGFADASVVIRRACNYPTEVASEVLRRNAIGIAELPGSRDRLLFLDR